ncbi:hypothetical protein M758_4G139900 [Ceratodon purpureus]|nr:hypothetical protein M758_4G139900 [Ceratodon purpureus]
MSSLLTNHFIAVGKTHGDRSKLTEEKFVYVCLRVKSFVNANYTWQQWNVRYFQ